MTTARFAGAQELLIGWFSGLSGVNGASTKTPADLLAVVPFIRVMRIGGMDSRVEDHATVDIDCFAANEIDAEALAEMVREQMIGLNNRVVDGHLIDYVSTVVAPAWIDWADENVQRYVATYEICVRAFK